MHVMPTECQNLYQNSFLLLVTHTLNSITRAVSDCLVTIAVSDSLSTIPKWCYI